MGAAQAQVAREQDLEKYRLQPVGPEESKALRGCRAFTGDVLLVESEHDTVIPHQVIVNYREAASAPARSTYRLIEGADHGLSTEAMQNAYTLLLVKWFTEIVFGQKPPEPAPPASAQRRGSGDGARGGVTSPADAAAARRRRTGKMRGRRRPSPPTPRETPHDRRTPAVHRTRDRRESHRRRHLAPWPRRRRQRFRPDRRRDAAAGSRSPIRFVFPHAPVRPVTLNNGFRMRAWYDIAPGDIGSRADVAGVRIAGARRGAHRAGEGARHRRGPHRPRRILARRRDRAATRACATPSASRESSRCRRTSCCPTARGGGERRESRRADLHGARNVRSDDPPRMGRRRSHGAVAAGYAVEWHTYPMPHSVVWEEIEAIGAFLARTLAAMRRWLHGRRRRWLNRRRRGALAVSPRLS